MRAVGKHEGRRQTGFTLIELMIVVAILGVLAALAIPLFNKYIRRTKTSEVVWMFNQIRLKQEQYHGFFGQYASIPNYHPSNIGPSLSDNIWNPPDGDERKAWESLGVRPQGRYVYFQYKVEAGRAGETKGDAGSNGLETNRDWWYAQARGDLDGDGEKSFFETTSQRSEVYSERDVE